ncbi:hypothetical protein AXG93_2752s1110 [Marchantia polymorpha subsp. ruderalis]|uniref:Uncharacterized protein n=1 Tax=Marchantia polymorpha subsp. ruderalis TaxID=1480154 RepID=A0A176VTM8_MARPO|nr:hypothetical protein AXG93_2752s1110 [Marchantia polymorpha subsp. ruderalis]
MRCAQLSSAELDSTRLAQPKGPASAGEERGGRQAGGLAWDRVVREREREEKERCGRKESVRRERHLLRRTTGGEGENIGIRWRKEKRAAEQEGEYAVQGPQAPPILPRSQPQCCSESTAQRSSQRTAHTAHRSQAINRKL